MKVTIILLITLLINVTDSATTIMGRGGRQQTYNECEMTGSSDQSVQHRACTPEPSYLFARGNTTYLLRVTPPEHTCGVTQPEKYCKFVRGSFLCNLLMKIFKI